MSYVRHDKDCKVATVQPNHTVATDAFGNTFKNWCADYVKSDVDCKPIGSGCVHDNQDPGKLPTTSNIPLIPLWEHMNFDSTAQRPLSAYVKSPTFPVPFIPIEGETILGLTQTRDLILLSPDTPYLRLEDSTMVMPSALN